MQILNKLQVFTTCFSSFVDEYLTGVTQSSQELLNSGSLSPPVSLFIESSLQQREFCSQSIANFKTFKHNYTQSLIDALFSAVGTFSSAPSPTSFHSPARALRLQLSSRSCPAIHNVAPDGFLRAPAGRTTGPSARSLRYRTSR